MASTLTGASRLDQLAADARVARHRRSAATLAGVEEVLADSAPRSSPAPNRGIR